MAEVEDPVPVITRAHFEEAFACARKSVSTHDLYKFDEFRKKMDPAYAKKVDGSSSVSYTHLTLPTKRIV